MQKSDSNPYVLYRKKGKKSSAFLKKVENFRNAVKEQAEWRDSVNNHEEKSTVRGEFRADGANGLKITCRWRQSNAPDYKYQ